MTTHTYLIGEIGQNHNGSVDIAKLTIDLAARSVTDELFNSTYRGLDAVKLTKRDLNQELSKTQGLASYKVPHSFGKTYLEHRKALELSDEQHLEIYRHAKTKDLDFVETLCAIGCLSILDLFQPDYLKVASRDLTNLPLLAEMARTRIPMIISTGMAGKVELDKALGIITKIHDDISILHCVSQYPTDPKNVNLKSISFLKHHYPKFKVGYSDHTIGISAPVAAIALGAEIIEKHITIDRRMKGSDQAGSLGPDGLSRMVRDIRLTELSMGVEDIFEAAGVEGARKKLERSIATRRPLPLGHQITEDDIHLLSPGDGLPWSSRNQLVGKTLSTDLDENTIIYPDLVS